jgi:hypothetical protein
MAAMPRRLNPFYWPIPRATDSFHVMLRPAWLRALAAVWAIWLQAALLDPGSFDHCPEHGHHAVATQMAEHAEHASHDHGAPADHHGQHSCTCLGACCCAPAVLVPATSVDLPPVVTVAQTATPYAEVRVVAAARPHSLPFANGPPVATPRALTA